MSSNEFEISEKCPLCLEGELKFIHINLEEDVKMCMNERCVYPFEVGVVSEFVPCKTKTEKVCRNYESVAALMNKIETEYQKDCLEWNRFADGNEFLSDIDQKTACEFVDQLDKVTVKEKPDTGSKVDILNFQEFLDSLDNTSKSSVPPTLCEDPLINKWIQFHIDTGETEVTRNTADEDYIKSVINELEQTQIKSEKDFQTGVQWDANDFNSETFEVKNRNESSILFPDSEDNKVVNIDNASKQGYSDAVVDTYHPLLDHAYHLNSAHLTSTSMSSNTAAVENEMQKERNDVNIDISNVPCEQGSGHAMTEKCNILEPLLDHTYSLNFASYTSTDTAEAEIDTQKDATLANLIDPYARTIIVKCTENVPLHRHFGKHVKSICVFRHPKIELDHITNPIINTSLPSHINPTTISKEEPISVETAAVEKDICAELSSNFGKLEAAAAKKDICAELSSNVGKLETAAAKKDICAELSSNFGKLETAAAKKDICAELSSNFGKLETAAAKKDICAELNSNFGKLEAAAAKKDICADLSSNFGNLETAAAKKDICAELSSNFGNLETVDIKKDICVEVRSDFGNLETAAVKKEICIDLSSDFGNLETAIVKKEICAESSSNFGNLETSIVKKEICAESSSNVGNLETAIVKKEICAESSSNFGNLETAAVKKEICAESSSNVGNLETAAVKKEICAELSSKCGTVQQVDHVNQLFVKKDVYFDKFDFPEFELAKRKLLWKQIPRTYSRLKRNTNKTVAPSVKKTASHHLSQ